MWRAIFHKEFAEVFSDSRTIFNVVVGPLLFTPLLLAGIGSLARNQAAETASEKVVVAVAGASKAPSVAAEMKFGSTQGITFTTAGSLAEVEQMVRDRRVGAGLVVGAEAERRMKSDLPAPVTVVADTGNEASSHAADRLKDYLHDRGERLADRRLHAKGLTRDAIRPFEIGDLALKGSAPTMLLLAGFLPYILAMSAIMGGLMAASNTVAGEKERGTLETLLVTPVSRTNIALGKFLMVTATALLSSTLSLVGMLWPFYVKLPMFAWMASQGLSLKPAAIIALVLVQVPLALFGAGVLLALSTYAKNQKEMQTYTLPVVLLGTVGSMLSMLLKPNCPLYWAFVPVTNAALVLKQALQGIISAPFIAMACVTSMLYAACAVLLAAQLFRRESVLTRF